MSWIRKIWDKFVALIYKIPFDKWLHILAGLIISAFACITLHVTWPIVAAITAGFIKEFFDRWTTGQWDWWDFVATLFGGAIIQFFAAISL